MKAMIKATITKTFKVEELCKLLGFPEGYNFSSIEVKYPHTQGITVEVVKITSEEV
jgi:hypothetical protein